MKNTMNLNLTELPVEEQLKALIDDVDSYGHTSHHWMLGDRILFLDVEHDETCSNPLEDCDGMGLIYSFNTRHVNSVRNQEEADELLNSPGAVLLSYFEHGMCKWGVAGSMSGMPDFRWDGVEYAGVWVPDRYALEHIYAEAAKSMGVRIETVQTAVCAMDPAHNKPWKLKVGRRYYSDWGKAGRAALNLAVKKVDIQLTEDGKGYAAVFPDGTRIAACNTKAAAVRTVKQRLIQHAAEKDAALACKEYTDWCNGNCWGVMVHVYTAKYEDGHLMDDIHDYRYAEELHEDSCWGYIGDSSRNEAIKEHLSYALQHIKKMGLTDEVSE